MMKPLGHAIWLGMSLALLHPATAQTRLETATTFPEPFSRVVGLRELPDGRVIIADRLESHVSYLDFASGSVTQISREGQGPGEYRQPIGLLPYPGDGTLLTDIGNMRIALIDRGGTIDETWPMMQQDESGSMTLIRPTGVDAEGSVYYSGAGIVMRTSAGGGNTAPPDSAPVVRLDLKTGAADTIAQVYNEPATGGGGAIRVSRGGGGGSFSVAGGLRPFAVADGWGVAADGRIAVVRATEYRVDWYDPDGTLHPGTPTEYRPVRIGQAEKNAWADNQSQNSVAMVMGAGSGGGGGSFQMPRPDIDEVEFPEVMPPFSRSAVSVAPNGDVWVRLNQPASEDQPLFDIFDHHGRKIRQVQFSAGRELIGFGNDVVYAVAIDEDDLQWLERYPYPKN